MKDADIDKVVSILKKEIPQWKVPAVTIFARTRDPFLVLVSTILSLRTKDAVTAAGSERLFKLAKTPKSLLKLTTRQIEKAIYPVGFYKTKAKALKGICSDLLTRYKGKVPSNIEDLMTMKGVGRKTANLVVTLGFDLPGICVDIHVHRICNRLGYVKTKTPDKTEFALRDKLPRKHWTIFNDLLVTYGQNLCMPVSPWCSKCKLKTYCPQIGVPKSR